ncbi:hypothetical protein BABINDRAFT_160298 [Babjeviella inositovora NRRL Y-12698]|uniref:Cytochrome c oxidase assembly protein COX20, mitochondrial n=1 Tax=Babjeviella inositovora NRRL Y-12698 TaxID=984486 RepID=A0A1E3QYB1_9ASCO|nr:uncharacterized protein BABINDRAFT_160298 [Babjeviella inositovora NRRL Y-12698]ODQ82102.1 hypothetical protein BABINDRAFT_160298 [Babjeviella inositovora NRRL Y-12698]
MVWPFSKSKPAEAPVEAPVPEVPQFLEDLPPKFNDDAPLSRDSVPKKSTLTQAVATIKRDDFSPSNMMKIPCFREGMMTGLSALGVLGAITFITSKNVRKATNWGMAGFLLGSCVGWEQCRVVRMRSFENVQQAKEVIRNKEK